MHDILVLRRGCQRANNRRGENKVSMIIACVSINWTLFVSVATLVATIVGIVITYHMKRVSQRIELHNRSKSSYVLLQSLTNTLQRAYEKSLNTKLKEAIEFVELWGDEIEKEPVIVELCKESDIDVQSLRFRQLKEVAERSLSVARYAFFKRESISGIDLIVELLQKYARVQEQYCKLCDIPFTDKDVTSIRDSIDAANKSISSMEKELIVV